MTKCQSCPFRYPPPSSILDSGDIVVHSPYQAYELYLEGRHYIVRDSEVVLIDESTGRLKPITRWQGGLHQVGLLS